MSEEDKKASDNFIAQFRAKLGGVRDFERRSASSQEGPDLRPLTKVVLPDKKDWSVYGDCLDVVLADKRVLFFRSVSVDWSVYGDYLDEAPIDILLSVKATPDYFRPIVITPSRTFQKAKIKIACSVIVRHMRKCKLVTWEEIEALLKSIDEGNPNLPDQGSVSMMH